MAAVCKSGTINLLTNLWTEAQAQLDVAQKTETHAFRIVEAVVGS